LALVKERKLFAPVGIRGFREMRGMEEMRTVGDLERRGWMTERRGWISPFGLGLAIG
jgi:hypothetical protein